MTEDICTHYFLTNNPTPTPAGDVLKICNPSVNLNEILALADKFKVDGDQELWLCDENMCIPMKDWSVEEKKTFLRNFNELKEEMYVDLLVLCEQTFPDWYG